MTAIAGYMNRGVSRAFWVPTVASKAAPTAAEINAGTELSAAVTEVNGFTFNNQPIETPTMDTAFTKKIPGADQVADSSMKFLRAKTSNPLQTTVAKGTTGFMVFFWGGTAGALPAAADKCDVWPETSTGFANDTSIGNDPSTWHADFAAYDTPAQNVAVV